MIYPDLLGRKLDNSCMKEIKNLIVAASGMPVSIIIIGVGNEELELMQELDSDNQILRDSNWNPALRDIVQFVKFNDVRDKGVSAVAEEVLKEVPDQMVELLVMNNILIS